jgi:FkbM family methyltransferase
MNYPEVVARNCKHGRMWVPVKDTFIGKALDFCGEYSEGEVDLFKQLVQPGQWVLDIGANLGAFTLPLAKLVGTEGRVIAFEPQPAIFGVLKANCEANKVSNAVLVNAAVGDESGEISVPDVDYGVKGNFGGVALGAGQFSVPMVTIDGLNLPACAFMKIDVEGMEYEALTGAEETIQRFRPLMYVENDRREKSARLISLLQSFGYKLYWHTPPLFNPLNFAGEEENFWPGIVSQNMLCVPVEYKSEVNGFEEIEGSDSWPECLGGRDA